MNVQSGEIILSRVFNPLSGKSELRAFLKLANDGRSVDMETGHLCNPVIDNVQDRFSFQDLYTEYCLRQTR
jgi:hypothetical protein